MHSEPARRYVMALLRRRLRETAMVCVRERCVSVVFGGEESVSVEGQYCHAYGEHGCPICTYLFRDDESLFLFLFMRIREAGASAFLKEGDSSDFV